MRGLHIFDSEGDGLLDAITKFHCFLFKEYNKDNWNLFLDFNHPEFTEAKTFAEEKNVNLTIRDFSELYEWLKTEPKGIGCHNLFGFDLPAMNKLLGIEYDMFKDHGCRGTIGDKQVDIFDTLSMSRCLYPDRPLPDGCPAKLKDPVTGKFRNIGPHGLEAWGFRVANKKVKIDDWRNQPLVTYIDRVWEDVVINEAVWTWLINESLQKDNEAFKIPSGDIKDASKMQQITWKNALRRNMLADYLMSLQEKQGVVFDAAKAWKLLERIDKMMAEIEAEIEPRLPPKRVTKSKQPTFPTEPFTQDGEVSKTGWAWIKRLGYAVDERAFDKVLDVPARPFVKGGGVSKTGKAFCEKFGITDESLMPDFINNYSPMRVSPLPEDEYQKAKQDLLDRREIILYEPMKLGNQADIKNYLVSQGWVPTLWRTKDVTRDDTKKQRTQTEIDELVYKYMEELEESDYKGFILNELDLDEFKFADKVKTHKLLVRRARGLPTSPQLKDQKGALCPNLEILEGEMAKQIVKWLSLRNRRGVIKPLDEKKDEAGWLQHPRLLIDGKLPARANGITNTNRRKHAVCCNVPKPKESVLLGKEMRELWTVPDDCFLIGVDGSNLEGMVAAAGAYMFDGGEYLRIMEAGDAHTRNAEAYTLAAGRDVSRDSGKNITYGIMYGAQAKKIAIMLGISMDAAQRVIDAFWDGNLGLKGRKEWLENFWEATGKKFIPSFDGRRIWTRSKHSLLNAYQQSSGACLFDLVGILFHHQITKNGMYEKGVRRVIYYHDEYQIQTPKEYVKFIKLDINSAERKLNKKEELETDKEVAERLAKEATYNGKLMAGKPKFINGEWFAVYSIVGELMVKCVEKAAQLMNFPVHITGEYLIGLPSEGWAGTH